MKLFIHCFATGSLGKCTGHNDWKTTGIPLETPPFYGEWAGFGLSKKSSEQ
jgi:hypothetical protein